MRFSFPLFSSHLDLAHQCWEKILEKGDLVIDATCGNGKDTLILAQLLEKKGGGQIIGLDIQETAIEQTRILIAENCPLFLSHLQLLHQSHASFPPLTCQPKLIVYNLGYLPGGDKTLTTMVSSTLESLEKALNILILGGVISLTCYPGHKEGLEEYNSLIPKLKSLNPSLWSVTEIGWQNRHLSPILLLIQKRLET